MPKDAYRTNEDLLEVYLSMSKERRDERFADTSRTADLIGMSQRTVQFWIETGAIRAVPIGGKLKVDLVSVKSYLKNAVNKNDVVDKRTTQ